MLVRVLAAQHWSPPAGNELDLVHVPRNLAKADGSANFCAGARRRRAPERLDEHRLFLATRVKPDGVFLDDVDRRRGQAPAPLNFEKVGEPRERLRNARKRMAGIEGLATQRHPEE